MGGTLTDITKKVTAILGCAVACWIDCHPCGSVLFNKLERAATGAEVPIMFSGEKSNKKLYNFCQ